MKKIQTHKLKTYPKPFQAVWQDLKRYEVRKNDRGFKVDDILHLNEYLPEEDSFTGRQIRCLVTYISEGGTWGLPEDICVLSIIVIAKLEE